MNVQLDLLAPLHFSFGMFCLAGGQDHGHGRPHPGVQASGRGSPAFDWLDD